MTENDLSQAKVVVLSDGRAGHENQSLGVAQALGAATPEVITLKAVHNARWLGWLPVEWLYGTEQLRDVPAADIVVGAGWQVSRVSRWLRQNAKKKPFTVQLMRPSGSAGDYDVVALPRHDVNGAWAKGAMNVVVTSGAPNRIVPTVLAQEGQRWQGRLQHCPAPRLAVMVGGTSRHGKFEPEQARMLVESALAWAKINGGSLLVSTSRRTGPKVTAFLSKLLTGQQLVPVNMWQPDDLSQRDNPYLAYLALADGVVVTAESVAMVSDAATAGKPVYLFGDTIKMPGKFKAFYSLLMQQQRLAVWQGKLTLRVPREGLADAALVAGFVQGRWNAQRGGTAA